MVAMVRQKKSKMMAMITRISTSLILVLLAMLIPLSASAHGGAKKTIEAFGVVNQVISPTTLNITTEPIKKLGWSETTMDWKVKGGVKTDHLSAGDLVKLLIKQSNNRLTYHIITITMINQPTKGDE